jgi:hypothetical protein
MRKLFAYLSKRDPERESSEPSTHHARTDGFVSVGVMLSAGLVAIGLPLADPDHRHLSLPGDPAHHLAVLADGARTRRLPVGAAFLDPLRQVLALDEKRSSLTNRLSRRRSLASCKSHAPCQPHFAPPADSLPGLLGA